TGDGAVFNSLYASLEAGTDPRRNSTIHSANMHTAEEAEHVFEAVRGFARRLPTAATRTATRRLRVPLWLFCDPSKIRRASAARLTLQCASSHSRLRFECGHNRLGLSSPNPSPAACACRRAGMHHHQIRPTGDHEWSATGDHERGLQ